MAALCLRALTRQRHIRIFHFKAKWVVDGVEPLEGRRHVEDAAHPAGDQSTIRLRLVFFGNVAERLRTCQAGLRQLRPAARRIRKAVVVVEKKLDLVTAPATNKDSGWKSGHNGNTLTSSIPASAISLKSFRTIFSSHISHIFVSCVGRPVVCNRFSYGSLSIDVRLKK